MSLDQHLAAIGLLCSHPLPVGHDGPSGGMPGIPATPGHLAGPGYRIVTLEAGPGAYGGGGAGREQEADDLDAQREGLARILDERWGPGQTWGTLTPAVRLARGEEIPEPWAALTHLVDQLRLWQCATDGRWVGLGLADRDGTDEVRLLAAVTDIDPP